MISRRTLVSGLALAGAAGLRGLRPEPAWAEPPPETTTLRIGVNPGTCLAPVYAAEDVLAAEGFRDVRYVGFKKAPEQYQALADGQIDVMQATALPLLVRLDQGDPIVTLAGIHVGCFELFGGDRIRGVRDLKGKSVAVTGLGSGRHVLLSLMLAHIGLDPRRDVRLVEDPPADAIQLLADGKLDAFMAFPPEPQELRARKIGHVVVDTARDRPWSQYFCCVLAGNREFVRARPVATKRLMRAVLKATDLCVTQPDRVARLLVAKKFAPREDYAFQALKEIPYDRWRQYDPEATLNYYALRLHELGMVKAIPQKLIAQGTDWRFLNELKRELKG